MWRQRELGETWAAGIRERKNLWTQAGKSCSGCATLGFFRGDICGVCYRADHCDSRSLSLVGCSWWPLLPSLFPASCACPSQLCPSARGAPKGGGSRSLLAAGGNSFQLRRSLLVLRNASLRDGVMQAK